MSRAYNIAKALSDGKEPEKNGDGYSCKCPVHGDKHNSMSIKDDGNGGVIVNCFTGCGYKEIKDKLRSMGLLPEWTPDKTKARKSMNPPPKPPPMPKAPEKPSFIWKQSDRDHDEDIIKTMEKRGIMLAVVPDCFKWNSYELNEGGKVEMIVAAASKPTDKAVYAVQRLFIDTETHTKGGAKMHGPCEGRAVWPNRAGDCETVAVSEGIETLLSVMQATGLNGGAGLSTSGVKNMIFPEETDTIYLFVDSDPVREMAKASMPGQKAAYVTAEKFINSREGRRAFLVSPDDSCWTDNPTKLDFNDLLQPDYEGESIGTRYSKAVELHLLDWSPDEVADVEAQEEPNQWFGEALENSSASRFLDNDPPELDWIFDGSLLARTTGMIVGPGAAGKSTLAILMLIAIATGRDILPGLFTPTKPGGALGIFGEDDEVVLHHRIHTMVNQLFGRDEEARQLIRQNLKIVTTTGQDVRFLSKASHDLEESHFFGEVFNAVKSMENLRLVILDPVSRFHGGEENDNGAGTFIVSLIERIAQRTGAAVIFLHHVGKKAGFNQNAFILDAAMHQDSARGASGLTNAVRWQCNLFVLPDKECKGLLGVKDPKPGQYLAVKVAKKNYGLPEEIHFLERQVGGLMKPFEPMAREFDQDLDRVMKELVLDAVLMNEQKHLTIRQLIDGHQQAWKKKNPKITRPAIEQTIAACILDGELFEKSGKNASGRTINFLSRYPDGKTDLEPEIEPEVLEPENRRSPEESEPTVYNYPNLKDKVDPEILNRRNGDLRLVSPCNYETVESEIFPPLRGDKTPSGLTGEVYPQCPYEDPNAEFF